MTALADIPTDAIIAELMTRRERLRGELLVIEEALDRPHLTCKAQALLLAQAAAEIWGIEVAQIYAETNKRHASEARHAVALILRTRRHFTLQEIGDELGGRDHSTIIHACKNMQARLENDPKLANKVQRLIVEVAQS